jgi:hypothetical protein
MGVAGKLLLGLVALGLFMVLSTAIVVAAPYIAAFVVICLIGWVILHDDDPPATT